jgi:hypothetical protein
LLAVHSGGLGSGRVVAGVGWERDTGGLEDAADLARNGGAGGDPLAVLVDRCRANPIYARGNNIY